jgi:hypothetical protein
VGLVKGEPCAATVARPALVAARQNRQGSGVDAFYGLCVMRRRWSGLWWALEREWSRGIAVVSSQQASQRGSMFA